MLLNMIFLKMQYKKSIYKFENFTVVKGMLKSSFDSNDTAMISANLYHPFKNKQYRPKE